MKISSIVLGGAATGILIAFFVSCSPTPKDCADICHKLNMEPTFVPIAGDPHACDCKEK